MFGYSNGQDIGEIDSVAYDAARATRCGTMERLTLAMMLLGALLASGRCSHLMREGGPVKERGGEVHPALRIREVPSGLGVNIHFYEGTEKDWSMLSEAGVAVVRMDVSWAGAEKAPGEYDFTQYDRLIEQLEARGIGLLFIIDYGNPLYDDGLAPQSETCRAAYSRFCSALAARYAGKEIIWELWNEPNISFWQPKPNVDDYLAWCQAVVPALRGADPAACIVAPATSGVPMKFLEDCFQRGLLELVDGVSVHPYRAPQFPPETAVADYARLVRLIERYRPDGKRAIPILSGEWGYTTTDLPRELQGKYLARQWLINMACGVPISIWYDWHDDGQDPNEREHNFGTVTWDYWPKPAYIAMKTLIDQLHGFMPVGRVSAGREDDYVVVFRRDGEYKLAAWTTAEAHQIDLGPAIRVAGGVDHLGQGLEVVPGSNQAINDGPHYLALAEPIPTWLHLLPIGVECAQSAVSGKRGDVHIRLALNNPTDREVRVILHPIEGDGVRGKWGPRRVLGLAAHEEVQALWRGTIYRRDSEVVSLDVHAEIRAESEMPYLYRRKVDIAVANPVSLERAWRHDGLEIKLVSAAEFPLSGRLIITVDGEEQRPVGVRVDPPETAAVVRLSTVNLNEGPRTVAARLIDKDRHILAEAEPLTYELVEPFNLALEKNLLDYYELRHDGSPDRGIDLACALVRAPGQDPPFPQAVKVDYDVGPGRCFWQFGPRGERNLGATLPKRIQLWLYGDDSGDRMRCRLVDSAGRTLQPDAGSMRFSGWRAVEFSLEQTMDAWGGAGDGLVHPPLRWDSFYLQDSNKSPHKGATYLTGVVVAR